MTRSRSRKHYSILFKLKVLRYAELYTVYAASATYGPTEKMIRSWRRVKQRLLAANYKATRSRVPYVHHRTALDEILVGWIKDLRERDLPVSGNQIQARARQTHSIANPNSTFTASNGWLEKFLARNNLVRRRVTTTGRELPQNTGTILADWFDLQNHFEI